MTSWRTWGSAGNYTLVIDTGKLGTDGAAALIESAIQQIAGREETEL